MFNRAIVKDSLSRAEREFSGNERRTRNGEEVVKFRTILAADEEDIFEPFGCDEGGSCAFAFE